MLGDVTIFNRPGNTDVADAHLPAGNYLPITLRNATIRTVTDSHIDILSSKIRIMSDPI